MYEMNECVSIFSPFKYVPVGINTTMNSLKPTVRIPKKIKYRKRIYYLELRRAKLRVQKKRIRFILM